MKAIHIKPLTPSVPPPYTDAHKRSLTHARTHSQYSIQALHNPVRQMDRLQTRTYTTSKRQSGRAAEREEKGGRWFTRETEPEREADLTSAAPHPTPPHALPPPSPNPLSKQTHNPHQERERNTRRLGDGSIYSCGASFGSFHTPCVCVCIRAHVCQRDGSVGGGLA